MVNLKNVKKTAARCHLAVKNTDPPSDSLSHEAGCKSKFSFTLLREKMRKNEGML